MRETFLISYFFISCLTTYAQKDDINFETGTWSEVLKKAKELDKPIYIDFYTTWCGPCKMMAEKYFNDSVAATFYNTNFINYKLDAEKDEGMRLATLYQVKGYPTNVFINPSTEKIIYKTSGCPIQLDGFINNGKIALLERNDTINIDDYRKKFYQDNYDSTFLVSYIEKNHRIGENNNVAVDTFLLKYGKRMEDSAKLKFIATYCEHITAKSGTFRQLLAMEKTKGLSEVLLGQTKSTMVYNTVEHAKRSWKEADFDTAAFYMKNYYEDGYDFMFDDWYEYRSYQKNMYKLKNLFIEYGNYFSGLSDSFLNRRNIEIFNQNKETQKKMALVKGLTVDAKLDSTVHARLMEQRRDKVKTISVADYLNTICWDIYEKMKEDKTMVTQAVNWARRAQYLSQSDDDTWFTVSDTFIRLLDLNGNGKLAIAEMQKLVTKARKGKHEKLKEYETYLKALKNKT